MKKELENVKDKTLATVNKTVGTVKKGVDKVESNKFIAFVLKYYKYAKDRRYDTLAGTLSFFFLLSFIPLLYLCLTLYVNMGTWFGLETPIPEAISQYVSFDVAAGASILFILTTIYSASKFFLQLRKTGEIAYGIDKPRTNIKSIVFSCILVIVSMIIVAAGLLGIAMGNQYLGDYVWAQVLIQLLTYLLIGGIFFGLIVVVNYFACQLDKVKIKKLMPGIIFSFVFAVLLTSFFGLYISFKNYDTLYGFFSTVIIAAGYVYFLMQGVVIGIIINEYRLNYREKQKQLEKETPTEEAVAETTPAPEEEPAATEETAVEEPSAEAEEAARETTETVEAAEEIKEETR